VSFSVSIGEAVLYKHLFEYGSLHIFSSNVTFFNLCVYQCIYSWSK